MWTNREQTERRLHALIADFLDGRGAEAEGELDLGVFALVAEVKERRTPTEIEEHLGQRKRAEAEYSPAAEWDHTVWYRCSDSRGWITAGLFRTAMLVAEENYDESGSESEPD